VKNKPHNGFLDLSIRQRIYPEIPGVVASASSTGLAAARATANEERASHHG